MSYLSQQIRPRYVTFLTDVAGVYDRPPSEYPTAILLKDIKVNKNKQIVDFSLQVSRSDASNDVTGGFSYNNWQSNKFDQE